MSSRYRTLLANLTKEQLLLDAYPNSVGAYSLRLLRKDYTGNCIEVMRSSDNTLSNIGFVNGVLDTASLLSFVGAGNGFVRTWYDQSGTNNHLFNINVTAYPRIVTAGVVVLNPQNIISLDFTLGGDKLLTFTSGTTFRNVNYGAIFSIYQDSNSTRRDVAGFHSNTQGFGRFILSDSLSIANRESIASRRLDSDSLSILSSTSNKSSATRLVTGVINWDNASSFIKRNGTIVASSLTHGTSGFTSNTNSIINNNTTFDTSGVGRAFVASPVKFISEIIFYNTNQDSNIAGIETNINNFYNIY